MAVAGSNGTAKGTAKGSKSAGGGFEATAGGFSSQDAKDIADWRAFSDDIIYRNKIPASDDRKANLSAATSFGEYIAAKVPRRPEDIITVRSGGRLQAAAYVLPVAGSLEVRYLASAPWNIAKVPGDSRVVRGAGTAAIVAIIKESVKRGYGGKVELEAAKEAIGFYKKLGFKQDPNGYQLFKLSAEDADKLLKMHGG